MKKYQNAAFLFSIFIGDLFLVYLSFYISYQIRFYFVPFINIFPITKGIPQWQIYHQFFYLTIFLWTLIFISTGFYQKKFLSGFDELIVISKGTTVSTIILMAITFLYREHEYSRLVIGLIWFVSTALIFLWHEISKFLYLLFTVRSKNVLIVGNAKELEVIKKIIRKHKFIRPFFILNFESENSLFEFVNTKNIQEVFLISSSFNRKKLVELADRFDERNISFKIVPDILQMRLGEVIIDTSLGIPIFSVKSLSLSGTNFYYKRIFDVVVSIILLSIFFLPLAVISLLIKLDTSGPILYYHKRLGYKNRAFNFFKFRTMVNDADKILEKLKNLSERKGPVFKMRNDPRITRVGKFLRRYSIDEIPQLINVLRGEMSLVGPRPQVLWEAEVYDNWAKRRLRVLPGITGLWQVSGRADLSYQEMIELDIYYVENWSPGLDLKILLKTLPAIFSRKGAY